jgi:hypothetical protein
VGSAELAVPVRDLGAELTVLGAELSDVSVGEGEVSPKGGF